MVGSALLVLMSLSPLCTHTLPQMPRHQGRGTPSHEALYKRGIPFAEFLREVDQRKDAWHEHFDQGRVPGALLSRARAVGGHWQILAVAEDWCGDSVNTIPYLARLVDAVAGLELRVVDSDAGRAVMEAHRTPDGRAATPTVVVLDDRYREVGCFVERPTMLQTWFLENQPKLDEDELYRQKYAWYDEDGGRETVREMVELIEAASTGAPGPCQ